MMNRMRATGWGIFAAILLGGICAQAAELTFYNFKERGGTGTDAGASALTLTGFTSGNLGVVSGIHTQTVTVSNIDLGTGLIGGADSFSFDLVQSTEVDAVQFRNATGVFLSTGREPLTVSIENIQILSGSGSVNFGQMTTVGVRTFFPLDAPGSIDVYAGTGTAGTLLGSATGDASNLVTLNSANSAITLDYELNGGSAPTAPIYESGIGFKLIVTAPELAGNVTSAFIDDYEGHTLVTESDLSDSTSWTLTGTQITNGVLSAASTAWVRGDFSLSETLDLANRTTVLYYSAKYNGTLWSDQINASLHAVAAGVNDYAGACLKANGAASSLWERGWIGLSVAGSTGAAGFSADVTTNNFPVTSTSEFVDCRIVYDATAGSDLLITFEQYVGSWSAKASYTVTNYMDGTAMGGSEVDYLRLYFRSIDDVVSDIAITQSPEFAAPGLITTAFSDDLSEHELVYESDFSVDTDWSLTECSIAAGELSSLSVLASNTWCHAVLPLSDLDLNGRETAVYYNGKYSSGNWYDQINVSLHAAAAGTNAFVGAGLKAKGAAVSLDVEGWLGASVDGASWSTVGGDILAVESPQTSITDFIQCRVIMDGAVAGELAMSFEQYSGGAWNTVSTYTMTNYTDSLLLGGSAMDALDFCFREQGEVVTDVAITQTPEPTATANGVPVQWMSDNGVSSDYDAAELTDLDEDGLLMWEEYYAGTDPDSASSVFAVSLSGSELSWIATTNSGVILPVDVYRSIDLLSGWTQVATNVERSVTGTTVWTDPNPPTDAPALFYKSVIQLP